jgi:hypothetical protein
MVHEASCCEDMEGSGGEAPSISDAGDADR